MGIILETYVQLIVLIDERLQVVRVDQMNEVYTSEQYEVITGQRSSLVHRHETVGLASENESRQPKGPVIYISVF